MKEKVPFTTLSETVKMEIERLYPYVARLKLLVQNAITTKEKGLYFNVLKKAETHISSEVSKLRNKPNRATKYIIYMKRLISSMKLMLSFLQERQEKEAYATLALIMCHYFNILLASSMKSRFLPRTTASSAYNFLKMIFDSDNEYVLDVLICSNVAESAIEANSVAFHILSDVLQDQHLYLHDAPTFTKFCTVAALLKESTNGKEIVRQAIKDLSVYPSDLRSHLESKYDFPKKIRFNVSTVIDTIQPRKVASVTRNERLIVASSGRKTKKGQSGDKDLSGAPSKPHSRPNDQFFYDLEGMYGQNDNEVSSSSFQVIDFTEDEDEDENPNADEQSDNESVKHEIKDTMSEVESFNGSEMEEHGSASDVDEEAESDAQNLGSIIGRPFHDMFERRETRSTTFKFDSPSTTTYTPADNDKSEESDEDSTLEMDVADKEQSDSDDCTLVVTPKTPVTPIKTKQEKKEESDDDIQELFVYAAPAVTENDNNDEEERDLAEPESGEDEVPIYAAEDYLAGSNRSTMMNQSESPKKIETEIESPKNVVSSSSPKQAPSSSSSSSSSPSKRRKVEAEKEKEENVTSSDSSCQPPFSSPKTRKAAQKEKNQNKKESEEVKSSPPPRRSARLARGGDKGKK